LGKDRFEVLPHVSSMQLAFARVKESWDEAYLGNLASTDLNLVVEKTRTAEKVGLFTTEDHPPSKVAAALLARGIDYFSVYVCENLGSPDERVTQCGLGEVEGQPFSALNVMILIRKAGVPDQPSELVGRRLFGNPDDAFLQSKPKRGLITAAEVRVIALAELGLQARSTVWDVGAGSGAVAVEAARLANAGRVYAIEMDAEDYQLIAENAQRFGVTNLVPILGPAPQAWEQLPDPDAVFIGGTGRAVGKICRLAIDRLRTGGAVVANITSINHVAATHELLLKSGLNPSVRMINISLSTDQMESIRFEALNPTFLLTVTKD
jgi:precorrin-6Y C5,15-methyltransferase (decarboxylating)